MGVCTPPHRPGELSAYYSRQIDKLKRDLATRDETIGKLWAALGLFDVFTEAQHQTGKGVEALSARSQRNPDALLAALGVDDE